MGGRHAASPARTSSTASPAPFATDVITDGPSYAIDFLDIPKDEDGNSTYTGPYVTKSNDTGCLRQGRRLRRRDKHHVQPEQAGPVTSTTPSPCGVRGPVPKAADTGEKYDDAPRLRRPVQDPEYNKGNSRWSSSATTTGTRTPTRTVRPTRTRSSSSSGSTRRTSTSGSSQDAGADKNAIAIRRVLEPADLATVFNDPQLAEPRRSNELDPYSLYLAINAAMVPNLKHRQAIAVALDRAQLTTIAGGDYAGDAGRRRRQAEHRRSTTRPRACGPTCSGKAIPDNGDPEYAKQLIAESGRAHADDPLRVPADARPTTRPRPPSRRRWRRPASRSSSNPIEAGQYYTHRLRPGQGRRADQLPAGVRTGRTPPPSSRRCSPRPVAFEPLPRQRQGLQRQGASRRPRTPTGLRRPTQWKELNKYAMQQSLGHPDPVRE